MKFPLFSFSIRPKEPYYICIKESGQRQNVSDWVA